MWISSSRSSSEWPRDSYYDVVAEELPTRGYPVKPVFVWRLPTLAGFLAFDTSLRTAQIVLWAIGGLTIWAWALAIGLRAGAVALILIAPLWLAFSSSAVYMAEVWAGQLVALGLACWALGAAPAALLVLTVAAAVREHALVAWLIVGAVAWRAKVCRACWAAALVGLALLYIWHFSQVMAHTPPTGFANGWGGLPGWAFMASAVKAHVLLVVAPYWVSALVVSVCVPLLWLWPQGRLVAVITTVYAAIFSVLARPDNWYWGFLVLPLLPLGGIALAGQAFGRTTKTPNRDAG